MLRRALCSLVLYARTLRFWKPSCAVTRNVSPNSTMVWSWVLDSREEEAVAEERTYRYTVRKDGMKPRGFDCVHTAREVGESQGAELWRNLPSHSYKVCDYGAALVEEEE